MTEAEAMLKVCHLSLASSNQTKCLGSGCMAWAWREAPGAPMPGTRGPATGADADGFCADLAAPVWSYSR